MRNSLLLALILSQVIACDKEGSSTNTSANTALSSSPATSPSLNFAVSATLINSGESVSLSWDASNVATCTASGDWSGPKVLSNSEESSPLTVDSSFALNCGGDNGSISKTVNVAINIVPPVNPPSLSFTSNQTLINSGETVNLSWDASNVDTCTASGNWSGTKVLVGSEESPSIFVNSTFILNCGGINGNISKTVNVSILKHDMTRANSYDDAWESAWVANAENILATPISGITKTDGKVLQVGDSMTYSFAYGLWARSGVGSTATDSDTISWMFGDVSNQNNGWDWSSGGVTAKNNMSWWDAKIDQIFVDPRLNDAQFAVLMMNVPTNDPTDLTIVEQRVNEFIANGIVPVLSTIPPRTDPTFELTLAEPYNTELRALAQRLSLPIIDYSKEILLRRPNGTWENTIISSDGVHPSGGVNGYTPESDPYTHGGDPTTHTTGDATLNSGYLLRTWLAVQKMKEIKQYVDD